MLALFFVLTIGYQTRPWWLPCVVEADGDHDAFSTGHTVPNCNCHSTLWRKPTDGVWSKCSGTHEAMNMVYVKFRSRRWWPWRPWSWRQWSWRRCCGGRGGNHCGANH